MLAPPKPCTKCGKVVYRNGLCPVHYKQADARRGSSKDRGYDKRHEYQFRRPILERDPICCVCNDRPSVVADHYPIDRVDLVKAGENPNDPRHGRGLCKRCHDQHTARKSFGKGQ